MSAEPSDDDAVHDIWVRTDPAADGTYVAVVELGDDVTIELDRGSAADWAHAVLEQALRAVCDADAVRQVTDLTSYDLARQVLVDLRAERPLPSSGCHPLALIPAMRSSGDPFLWVFVGRDCVGKWTIGQAEAHAAAVVEAVIAAELNAGYRRALVGVLGVGDDTARAIVDDRSRPGHTPPAGPS